LNMHRHSLQNGCGLITMKGPTLLSAVSLQQQYD